jgi:hypothetical protein
MDSTRRPATRMMQIIPSAIPMLLLTIFFSLMAYSLLLVDFDITADFAGKDIKFRHISNSPNAFGLSVCEPDKSCTRGRKQVSFLHFSTTLRALLEFTHS